MKKIIFALLIIMLTSIEAMAHHRNHYMRHYHHTNYRGYHHRHYRGYMMNDNAGHQGMPRTARNIQMPPAPPMPTEP